MAACAIMLTYNIYRKEIEALNDYGIFSNS